jgi:hypothetical protein
MADVAILKSLWRRDRDGRWYIHAAKGLTLKPRNGFDSDFFTYDSQMELMTSNPGASSIQELLSSFGPTDFLMKQSIVPVIAWVEGETVLRCIGTAFVISCTGYLITACHVLLDPQDRQYAKVVKGDSSVRFLDGVHMGVLIPISPASGHTGDLFFPFEQCWYWGEWKDSPLLHERETFDVLTDIAICKIPLMPGGAGHQPLNLSLNRFRTQERAFAFGYAEMDDIPFEVESGRLTVPEFAQDLYVSVGEVMDIFPDNHQRRDVPTPGPCFDFRAKVPGKMSGGPIFGGDGVVVRGVISRSCSGERHAYGAMLGPAMRLPLAKDMTLREMMNSGQEGIAKIQGEGL